MNTSFRWHALSQSFASIVLIYASGLYDVFASPDDFICWSLIEDNDRNDYTAHYRWEADLLVGVIDCSQRHDQLVYDNLLPAI